MICFAGWSHKTLIQPTLGEDLIQIRGVSVCKIYFCKSEGTVSYHAYIYNCVIGCVAGLFNGWVSIAAFGAICMAMWYGGKLVFEKELSVGTLTSFLVYTVQIAGCLAIISSLYGEFMQVCFFLIPCQHQCARIKVLSGISYAS